MDRLSWSLSASRSTYDCSSRSESGSDGETETEEVQGRIKHRFSEPWEDSDLILVVEGERFHVHRLILSMNSPVFKAMFKSQFKEASSEEIPLPEKKANEVLDLLKHVYSKHFFEESVEITIENVEHLLKLSDEYQVKHVFDACINFVKSERIENETVMKLRRMSDLYNLDTVAKGCKDFISNMKLKNLYEAVKPEHLDQETLRHFLEQRIYRLETFFDKMYPEFMGMVECLFWLMQKSELGVSWCEQHVTDGKFKNRLSIDSQEVRECSRCQRMLYSVWRATSSGKGWGQMYWNYHYGGHPWQGYHFQNLESTIKEFCKLKNC